MSQAVLRIAPKGQLFQVTGRHGVAETCERERIRSDFERVGKAAIGRKEPPSTPLEIRSMLFSVALIIRPFELICSFKEPATCCQCDDTPTVQHASGDTSGTAS